MCSDLICYSYIDSSYMANRFTPKETKQILSGATHSGSLSRKVKDVLKEKGLTNILKHASSVAQVAKTLKVLQEEGVVSKVRTARTILRQGAEKFDEKNKTSDVLGPLSAAAAAHDAREEKRREKRVEMVRETNRSRAKTEQNIAYEKQVAEEEAKEMRILGGGKKTSSPPPPSIPQATDLPID